MMSKAKQRNVNDGIKFILVLMTVLAVGIFVITTLKLTVLIPGKEIQTLDCGSNCVTEVDSTVAKIETETARTQLENRLSGAVAGLGLLYFIFIKPDKSRIVELP